MPSDTRVFANRYELGEAIGRGGMADVYLAHDRLLDRRVAVKVLAPNVASDPTNVERFRREAQSAAGLNHPHIVAVYDWGQDDGTPFIVMEYVPGQPQGQVKVTDFGIARAETGEPLTKTGAVLGTATYFSPEQAQGFALDGRSDVYALGVVLYEMLTGVAPFTAASPVSVAYKHVRDRDRTRRGERRDAGEHLVEHDAERVHVGTAVEREALRLLRREVGRGAEHRARLRERLARLRTRDPEVGD